MDNVASSGGLMISLIVVSLLALVLAIWFLKRCLKIFGADSYANKITFGNLLSRLKRAAGKDGSDTGLDDGKGKFDVSVVVTVILVLLFICCVIGG